MKRSSRRAPSFDKGDSFRSPSAIDLPWSVLEPGGRDSGIRWPRRWPGGRGRVPRTGSEPARAAVRDGGTCKRPKGSAMSTYLRIKTTAAVGAARSEEHTSELQSQFHLVC